MRFAAAAAASATAVLASMRFKSLEKSLLHGLADVVHENIVFLVKHLGSSGMESCVVYPLDTARLGGETGDVNILTKNERWWVVIKMHDVACQILSKHSFFCPT